MNVYSVLKRPVITEKSMKQAYKGNYVFEVDKKASKGLVKIAVENLFKVNVTSVKIVRLGDKSKRSMSGKKVPYTKFGIKKAIVALKKDQKIDLFEAKKGK